MKQDRCYSLGELLEETPGSDEELWSHCKREKDKEKSEGSWDV